MRKETEELTPDYPNLKETIRDMWDTLERSHGVGLAAPQVGLPIRLAIIDLDCISDDEPQYAGYKKTFINPYIEEVDVDIDGLNYLAGKSVQFVNSKAYQGTLMAHMDGGTPNIIVEIDEADAWHFGYLVYFFEKACGLSGYLLGVNPFDQPGVEAYKKNMFALLGKPGYEERKAELEKRLNK